MNVITIWVKMYDLCKSGLGRGPFCVNVRGRGWEMEKQGAARMCDEINKKSLCRSTQKRLYSLLRVFRLLSSSRGHVLLVWCTLQQLFLLQDFSVFFRIHFLLYVQKPSRFCCSQAEHQHSFIGQVRWIIPGLWVQPPETLNILSSDGNNTLILYWMWLSKLHYI